MIKRVKKKHKELKSHVKKYHDHLYLAFRVIVGLMFMQHGAQKLFGMFGGTAADLTSLFGVAGVVEFVGGLMIVIGLLTQYVAFIAAIQMLVAFFMVHIPSGIVPILNKGELALMFFAAFLVLIVYGGRKWAVDSYFK